VRIPAVALAAAFVCGIVLGLSSVLARFSSSSQFLLGSFLAVGVLLLAGLLFVRLGWLAAGAGSSLLCWVSLGILGAMVAQQPLPSDHVVTLVDGGRLDLHSPLRWYGTLRDEPARLPWGYGYEIELSGVDYQGDNLPLHGGMRLSFTPHAGEDALPELHAGDTIAVLAEARRPQMFKDDGAFDRRAYLAAQEIDLTAGLRSPLLLERTSVARVSASVLVARVRRRLRDEVDSVLNRKLLACCGRCCWGIAVLLSARNRRIFRRPEFSMCWSSPGCTWERWPRFCFGPAASFGFRRHGLYFL
jgi:hypothetical protein